MLSREPLQHWREVANRRGFPSRHLSRVSPDNPLGCPSNATQNDREGQASVGNDVIADLPPLAADYGAGCG